MSFTHSQRLTAFLGAFALVLAGCSDDDTGPNDCAARLLPGDLVITEIMANPKGADDGKEWFEIYNATTAPVDLTEVRLVFSKADGSSRKTHLVTSGTIGAGEYFVFGGMLEVAKPAYVDYGYANSLGAFTNTGGRLALECGNTIVDEVVYLATTDGYSQVYDGSRVPDAMGNDNFDAWCNSQTEYEEGSFGTPGEANDPCDTITPPGTCLDGEITRNTVPPTAGSVVITELMPDPNAVSDLDGEWFEVYFGEAADLNGLQMGRTAGEPLFTVPGGNCLSVAAGTHVLIARKGDSAVNGGLPPVDVVWPALSLGNSGGSLFVGYGGDVLDEVVYTAAMVSPGRAIALDPDFTDPDSNDNPENWCFATETYGGGGDLGTPGAENSPCGFVPPSTCMDGETSRDIVPPEYGNVVFTEIMANPEAVSDANGEWFEIYFAEAADLNGLQLGVTFGTPTFSVSSAACLPVSAGTYVLVARHGDSAVNGGLPAVDVVWSGMHALANAGGSLFVGYGGELLDAVTYPRSDTAGTRGRAISLNPDHLDPIANDDPGNWCVAIDAYGAGDPPDSGTPGAANPLCFLPPGTCLDGGTPRVLVPPTLGGVVITEIMASVPTPPGDAAGEWFEVYFAQDTDINGLVLGDAANPTQNTIQSLNCIRVAGGSYVVFARNANSAVNGGLTNVTHVFTFTLNNTNETIYVSHDGTTLDSVQYSTSTQGVSRYLTAGVLDPVENDLATNWCLATDLDPYGAGGRGTPGVVNPSCP